MHQALDAGFQLHEGAVVGDVGDAAGEARAHGVLGVHAVPGVGLKLLHAERDALGLGVDLDDLDFDRVADGEHLAGMRHTLPAHVGDVQQAVDAAEVHERAVVGDVLDHAFAHFAFRQLADQFGALFGAGFFQDGAAGDDDVAARTVHLEDLERLFLAHQRADVTHRADVDLRARQEGRGAAEVDGEASLHPADDGAHHRLAVGEDDFEASPGFFAAGLLAADHRLAHRVLDALQIDLDVVADLDRAHAVHGGAEFLHLDAAFGLQADVDDGEVLLDAHDFAVDHLALHHVAAGHLFVEERGEVVTRRGHYVRHIPIFPNAGRCGRIRLRPL